MTGDPREWTKTSGIWFVALGAIVIVGLGLFDFSKARLQPEEFLRSKSGRAIHSWLPINRISVIPDITAAERPRFVTDPGLASAESLWALAGTPGNWKVSSWQQEDPGSLSEPPGKFEYLRTRHLQYPKYIEKFDIGPWGSPGASSLFSFKTERRAGGGNVTVTRLPLVPAEGPAETLGSTPPLPRLAEGSQRVLQIRNYSGPMPDLYVVDSAPSKRWRISVYSGESRFQSLIARKFTVEVVAGPLSPKDWAVSLMQPPLAGPPDLSLVTTGFQSGTNHVELHILTERSEYREFPVRIATELDGHVRPSHQILITSPTAIDRDDRDRTKLGQILDLFPDWSTDRIQVRQIQFAY